MEDFYDAEDAFCDMEIALNEEAAKATLFCPLPSTPAHTSTFDFLMTCTSKPITIAEPKRKCDHHLLDDETFPSHGLMGCASPKNHGLSLDEQRLLARHGLVINANICSPCALQSKLRKCELFYDKSFAYCDHSGAQLFQASEAETNLMPFRPREETPNIFCKTAMDTVLSRKGFETLPCGYCGNKNNESAHHEIVDMGQIVRALFYQHDLLTWEQANKWVRSVLASLSNEERLPLRCCTECKNAGLHLRTTCFAAYAILRNPKPRKKERDRDEMVKKSFEEGGKTFDQYTSYMENKATRGSKSMSDFIRRKEVARGIADHYSSGLARAVSTQKGTQHEQVLNVPPQCPRGNTTSTAKNPDVEQDGEEDEEQWEESSAQPSVFVPATPVVTKKPMDEDKFYLPTYLSQIVDGFKVFDREFHSSLLNSAIALRFLVERSVFTCEQAVKVIVAVFNNSRWRMEREAGIKVQLMTRLGTMPGSPLKNMLENNGTEAFQNQLGVFVEAFVEQHLHSILAAIVKGENTGRSHLQWNEWLDQMSGFGISNQSSDALLIAVFWQWKNEGLQFITADNEAIPVLRRFDTAESKAFYDFDVWVRELREKEKVAANRPQAQHVLYHRQSGDDQCLVSSKLPHRFYELEGFLHTKPAIGVYQSEGFAVISPDDNKKGNKTYRRSKVLDVHSFRANLIFRAAQDLDLFKSVDQRWIPTIKDACTFLVLRPYNRSRSSGLRDADYCTKITQCTKIMQAPPVVSVHPKQKETGKAPLSIGCHPAQLPRSRIAAERIAAVRLQHAKVLSCKVWNRLALRLKKLVLKERAAAAMRELSCEITRETLMLVTPPETKPLTGEPPSLVRTETTVSDQIVKAPNEKRKSSAAAPQQTKSVKKPCKAQQTKGQRRRSSVMSMLDDELQFMPAHTGPVRSQSVAVMTTAAASSVVFEEASKDADEDTHHKLYLLRSEWRSQRAAASSSMLGNAEQGGFHCSSDDDDTHLQNRVQKAKKGAEEPLPEGLQRILCQ